MGAACSMYGDMSDKYKILVKMSQGNKPLGKTRCGRQDIEQEIEVFWIVWQLEFITSINMDITVFYDVTGRYVPKFRGNLAAASRLKTLEGTKFLYTDDIFLNPCYLWRHIPEESNLHAQLTQNKAYQYVWVICFRIP